MTAKAVIFNIQRFSIHDGPGIRTTVFFKGCPLRCRWCHNPEGLSPEKEIEYIASKCVGCGKCMQCPNGCHSFVGGKHVFDRTNCTKCGLCTEVCPAKALMMAGTEYTTDEVIAKVMSDEIFYRESGGGMTLSGGEPLIQIDFVEELLKKAKEKGLHTAVETSGNVPGSYFERIEDNMDLYLYDYKVTGRELHKKMTGVYPDLIMDNLDYLCRKGHDVILRCPIIPGVNDTEEHFRAITDILNRYASILKADIEPYHALGVSKYANLGMEAGYKCDNVDRERIEKLTEIINNNSDKKAAIN